jgi:hypothetical protein
MAPLPPPPSEWEKIAHFQQTYFIEGSPLSRPDLMKARVEDGEPRRAVPAPPWSCFCTQCT